MRPVRRLRLAARGICCGRRRGRLTDSGSSGQARSINSGCACRHQLQKHLRPRPVRLLVNSRRPDAPSRPHTLSPWQRTASRRTAARVSRKPASFVPYPACPALPPSSLSKRFSFSAARFLLHIFHLHPVIDGCLRGVVLPTLASWRSSSPDRMALVGAIATRFARKRTRRVNPVSRPRGCFRRHSPCFSTLTVRLP